MAETWQMHLYVCRAEQVLSACKLCKALFVVHRWLPAQALNELNACLQKPSRKAAKSSVLSFAKASAPRPKGKAKAKAKAKADV